jgi:hypothetical protein
MQYDRKLFVDACCDGFYLDSSIFLILFVLILQENSENSYLSSYIM